MAMRSTRSAGVVAATGRRPLCTKNAPRPPATRSTTRIASKNLATVSDLEHVHELLHCRRRLVQGGALGVGELDVPDLLDPLGSELGGHAHVQALDAELALQVAAAGQDLVLVLQYRVHHLRGGGGWRVIRGSRLEEGDDLGAAA